MPTFWPVGRFWRIVLMIALCVPLVVHLWWIAPVAALLLLPYLAWLCFAALLTASIWQMNPNASELVPGAASTDILL